MSFILPSNANRSQQRQQQQSLAMINNNVLDSDMTAYMHLPTLRPLDHDPPPQQPIYQTLSPSSTTMTTNTPPQLHARNSYCLRIVHLRHDPALFIPALFAELNLPPPASMWVATVLSTDVVRDRSNHPVDVDDVDGDVLWLVYHDAQVVSFYLFLLCTTHRI